VVKSTYKVFKQSLKKNMTLLMIIRIAFRALVRNKMRAALTMLGIIIGVSAVIAMVSIGQGAQASVQAQIAGIGTNLLFVSAGSQNQGGVRSGTGDSGTNTLTVEDLEAIKREVPTVLMVTPAVNTRSQLIFGNQNWNTQIQGVSEQYPEIRKWMIQNGSFFTDADVRSSARVIVVGQTIADSLFAGVDPVGQTVRVKDLPFRVVGVMARKGQDPQGRDQDDTAFAPYTSVQKKILGSPRVQIAYVSAISQDATYTAQMQITELLRQRHNLGPREPDDFTVRNMTDIAEAANETNNIMTILLASVAGVSLLVGLSYFFIKSSTAEVIAFIPVRRVDSGTGANSGECNDGSGAPVSLFAFTFDGSTAPSQNIAAGIFCSRLR
jgi:putative ABC transport system permease protein